MKRNGMKKGKYWITMQNGHNAVYRQLVSGWIVEQHGFRFGLQRKSAKTYRISELTSGRIVYPRDFERRELPDVLEAIAAREKRLAELIADAIPVMDLQPKEGGSFDGRNL